MEGGGDGGTFLGMVCEGVDESMERAAAVPLASRYNLRFVKLLQGRATWKESWQFGTL